MIDRSKMTIKKPFVLVVPSHSHIELSEFAWLSGFSQYSVLQTEAGWELTAPLSEQQRIAYTWLFHKMAGLEPKPTGPKGKPPQGTPPRGGTPGAGRKKKAPVLVEAVAA